MLLQNIQRKRINYNRCSIIKAGKFDYEVLAKNLLSLILFFIFYSQIHMLLQNILQQHVHLTIENKKNQYEQVFGQQVNIQWNLTSKTSLFIITNSKSQSWSSEIVLSFQKFNFKLICLKDHGSRTNGLEDIQVRNQCARKSHAYIAEVYTFISTPLYMRGFCGHANFELEYLLNHWSQTHNLSELRKRASTASVLAEHSGISQEHIGTINIISPTDDIDWNYIA